MLLQERVDPYHYGQGKGSEFLWVGGGCKFEVKTDFVDYALINNAATENLTVAMCVCSTKYIRTVMTVTCLKDIESAYRSIGAALILP